MARRNRDKEACLFVILALLFTLCLPGGCFGFDAPRNNEFQRVGHRNLPFLTFYTNSLATTPQLAFWQAVEKGRILKKCNIRVKLWKNLDELRDLLLEGKGDLWLGHTDTFVRAGLEKAPVQLLLTTGWRKFYLISSNSQTLHFKDFIGASLAFAPQGSPAVPVLRSLGFPGISFVPHTPKELMMNLVQGNLSAGLLPEPLVTKALFARSDLIVGENVEDVYGNHRGHLKGMPIVGIAVNSRTASTYPEIISWLARETMAQANILETWPSKGVESLPEEFHPFISKDIIRASVKREGMFAAYSYAVRSDITDYMSIIFGSSGRKHKPLSDSLFWKQ